MKACVFCNLREEEIICENELAIAFLDKYPVSHGHALIIPKRHFAEFFEATEQEIIAIYRLIQEVRKSIDKKYAPDGYNIGVNIGVPAGQTIFHLHVHVIPRYKGDIENPRGGVRKVRYNMVPYPDEAGYKQL